ncbi:MAG: sensor histidine kinase [Mucilaginibacter sp.]
MKLASHYTRASVLISLLVLTISAFVYYYTISSIARQQLDGDLAEEVAEFVGYVNRHHQLPKPVDFDQDQTSVIKTSLNNYETRFFDTPYFNKKDKKNESGRAVTFLVTISSQRYLVTISESRENTECLLQIISVITLALAAILLTVLIVTHKYFLKGLWEPFYAALGKVQEFNAADHNRIAATASKVDEFKQLNDAIEKMSARVTEEYKGLKTFTENAAHEIMTPLSLITSKLDILIQDESLRPDQYMQIADLYAATNRLSHLNQSLLLLVKIENDLLHDNEALNMKNVINEKFQLFQEMIQSKGIDVNFEMEDVEINASRHLAEILINNLFSNAIRHNREHGEIRIRLTTETLTFQNTGNGDMLDEHRIFDRFYKSKASEGTGLGLAIIKTICNKYNFVVNYRFIADLHSFEIKINSKQQKQALPL